MLAAEREPAAGIDVQDLAGGTPAPHADTPDEKVQEAAQAPPGSEGLIFTPWINGVLAPPLIVMVLLLTSNPAVMGSRANPLWLATLGWVTVAVMTAASCAMFATWK